MRYLVYSAYPKFYSASTFIKKNIFIVKISSRETLFKNTENTNKSCWFCDLEMVPVYCNFLSLDYFSNCTDILIMNFPHGLTNWPIPRHSKCQCVYIWNKMKCTIPPYGRVPYLHECWSLDKISFFLIFLDKEVWEVGNRWGKNKTRQRNLWPIHHERIAVPIPCKLQSTWLPTQSWHDIVLI